MEKCVTEPRVSGLEEETDDLRMHPAIIIWAKEMELTKADKALGDEIGWMVDSSQWEESLALLLDTIEL